MIQITQDFIKSIYKAKMLLICNSREQKDEDWGQTVENQNNSFYYFSISWSKFVAEAWKFHGHEKEKRFEEVWCNGRWVTTLVWYFI